MSDFSNYIDLSIFDLEPGDIYQSSLELARLTLPDFTLRPGTPEDAMFQAMAYMSALNIAAINRLPNRLMGGLVGILGYERQEAIPAQVDLVITLDTYDGGIVPEGTVFSYESFFEDELQEFGFTTTSAVEIPATDLSLTTDYPSVTVTVTAINGGIMPPIGANTVFNVVSGGTSIQSAITPSPANFANGIDADTDDQYLSKATTYLRSLTSALVKSSQVESFLLTQYPDVITRAKVYDLTNGDTTFGDTGVYRVSPVDQKFVDGSGNVTLRTASNHLFVVGDKVRVTGTGTQTDGLRTITSAGTTTFVFNVGGATATASTSITASAYTGEDVAGYITIVGYGNNSAITNTDKLNITSVVKDLSISGLGVSFLDPTFVTLSISGSIIVNEDYDATQVINSVNLTIIDFLNPGRFPFSDRIRQSQLISIISNIPGVIYVESLTLTPTGTGWLPKYGNDLLFRKKGTLPVTTLSDISLSYTIAELE